MHFNSLKISSCSPDVHTQVNNVLGGSPTTDAIKIPTTNSNLPHVTCSSDSVTGTVLNVTLYQTDNDPTTGEADRQRIEMSPTNMNCAISDSTWNRMEQR